MIERKGELRLYGRRSRKPHKPGPKPKSHPVNWHISVDEIVGYRVTESPFEILHSPVIPSDNDK